MASKRKFKRDYIILEAKDTNFRYKERILPKAFAKVEINDEKSIVSLYVENLKSVKEGYRVVAIQSDYETLELGNVVVGEQGKGEFVLNLDKDDIEIKGIALLYEKSVPLVGFKGSKIDNYEEILFAGEEEYEEYEYVEVEDGEDFEEYEEVEYIEIDEDEEYEYIEVEETDIQRQDEPQVQEYEYVYIEDEDEDEVEDVEEVEEEYEIEDEVEKDDVRNEEYEEYNNVEETTGQNFYKSKPKASKFNQIKSRPLDDENEKTAGALLMPRQIKKNLRYFKEVKPFVRGDIEDTRWWKIEVSPTSLCGYSMPYLGYVNSLNYTMYSDTVMNSYKYRHYLFGVEYDEYNKRKNYIYAIPGNKNEQPDKGHTGFTTYKPCDTRNDSLGYWLCFIDSRSRRILR